MIYTHNGKEYLISKQQCVIINNYKTWLRAIPVSKWNFNRKMQQELNNMIKPKKWYEFWKLGEDNE